MSADAFSSPLAARTLTENLSVSLHTPMSLFFRPVSATATLSTHIRGTGAAVAPLSCASARENPPIRQQLVAHIHGDQRVSDSMMTSNESQPES